METLPLIIKALVQGITEFLPISSSGHLILADKVLDQSGVGLIESEPQRLLFDIAVHVGSLLAVLIYFWRETITLFIGGIGLLGGRKSPAVSLFLKVLIASVPVIVVGLGIKVLAPTLLRESAIVIGWATLLFGLLLWYADQQPETDKTIDDLSIRQSLIIGLWQILALIPGTSRSGITMTGGRFLTMNRAEAAKFSMLLSIPAILGAGTLGGLDLLKDGNIALGADIFLATALSFLVAIVAIWLLMWWVRRSSFLPFVIYRILLGLCLLGLAYSGWLV